MPNYDFSTLGPLDFEQLACDLVNTNYEKRGLEGSFRTFGPGRDKGIDLLLSTSTNNYEAIGQVKHYIKSTFSKLLYDLKNTERDKVFHLKPNRYIVVTSLELSPQNKLTIKETFDPYIVSLDDIYGRQDLNILLRSNRNIEENHYKLWFSSSIVLNKILNYKFQGRQKEFTDIVLKRRFRLFVETQNFHKAKYILNQNKFIIITGEPGVGKSTLSDMMIYDFIKDDYQLNLIYDDIKEVEINLLDDDSKQVFYFDDFLGHTQAEILKSKSAENALIRIISRIENLDNKFLILNTRKFILISFLDESERFRKFNPLRSEAKIELQSYSYGVKRRMLDNHILESELSIEQIDVIKKLAPELCQHDNFTPRIIEFFTGERVLELNTKDYKVFILNNLKNPKEIWNHAYSFQINDYERFLLNTLYSLKSEVTKKDLEVAYNGRLNYEVEHNNYSKPLNSFNDSLRRLNNGFIVINDRSIFIDHEFETTETLTIIGFINPSLEDFLKYYIHNNKPEIERVLLSSKFIKQWYFFYTPYVSSKKDISKLLLIFFTKNSYKLALKGDNFNNLYLISIFEYYFNGTKNTHSTIDSLLKIENWSFLNENNNTSFYSEKFLNDVKSNSKLNRTISNFHSDFFFFSLINEETLDSFLELFQLFSRHYEFQIKDNLIKTSKYSIILFNHLKFLFDQEVEDQYNFLNTINTEEDINLEIASKLEKNKEFILNSIFSSFKINLEIFRTQGWNYKASINLTDATSKNMKDSSDYDLYADQISFYYAEDEYSSDYLFENQNMSLDDLISEMFNGINNNKKSNPNDINDDIDFFKDLDGIESDELPF
ncbi:nSTAND3 domain-containing NTPase [Aquimarina pacifica]|uniref:nSTAND3 domain-containing NTPase n=1 Tax=Aquimarina pacifica TaxID=1296415 RepID=UPI00046EC193|nr:hypothetical protein [Aquimarina pacifica]